MRRMTGSYRVGLFALVLTACGYAPITDGEIERLGITEGFAGNAVIIGGDCMPGPPKLPWQNTCQRQEALHGQVWFIPEHIAESIPVGAFVGNCVSRSTFGEPADYSALVAEIEWGQYGLTAAAGGWMPVLVEADGCMSCIEAPGAATACPIVRVAPSQVTKLDVKLERWSI